MGAAFNPFSSQFDALALRMPALGKDAGQLAGTRPVVIFAEQGSLNAGLFESPTAGGQLDHLKVGGDENLANVTGPAREKLPGRLPEKFELGRVIFVIDRSGSMGDALSTKVQQTKIEHIKERISKLSADYFPADTNITLIEFDSVENTIELGQVRNGGLTNLKREVADLNQRDGTDFARPLSSACKLLEEDAAAADPKADARRPVIIFLTDGHDSFHWNRDVPAAQMHRAGKLNASVFVVGIGEDYSMPRLITLAGHAGASSWSHLPMDEKALDVFDVQIPEMVKQLLTLDNYFKISAEGTYTELSAVTPAIRFAPPQHELIYPGYVRDAVGMLFEKREDLKLQLHAGRSVDDKQGYTSEIPIIDIEDAVGKFEQGQRAEDLTQRFLILRALLNRDVELLEEMSRVNPAIKDQLDSYVRQLEESQGGGSHDLYSSMTMTGNTSVNFIPPHMRPQPKPPTVPGDTGQAGGQPTINMPALRPGQGPDESISLHSGGLGALDNSSSIGSLPPIQTGKANAQAYNNAFPQRSDCAVLNVVKPTSRQIPLVKFDHGKSYIIGRSPTQPDGQALCIAEGVVSRRHCILSFDGERYLLKDLGSSNGTFHNGRKLNSGEEVELQDNDQIAATAKWVFTFHTPKV